MYTDILILVSLRRRAQHGYDIKRSIEDSFGGFFALTNSVLYPALQRFEEMGAVQREVVRQEGKPDRHIYTPTDRGHEVLHDLLCDFPPDVARREAEFLVRAAFFGLLVPKERIAILKTRQALLLQRRARLPRVREGVRDERLLPDIARVLALRADQTRLELEWIEAALQREQQPRGEAAGGAQSPQRGEED